MTKTTHVRAALSEVLPVLDAALARDGFLHREVDLPPRTLDVGGSTMTFGPDVPPNLRQVLVAESDGWVTIADDPLAASAWGEELSKALPDRAIVTLSAECDHVFFSTVEVHEGGALRGRSDVPADAVHEADGRHRIRPRFLAEWFPDAAAALDDGIVVNRLGGEQNSFAVAAAIGIANALLSHPEESWRAARYYELDPERAPEEASSLGGLAGAFQRLAVRAIAGMGSDFLKELGITETDPNALAQALLADMKSARPPPLSLEARTSSTFRGHVGDAFLAHVSFKLEGPSGSTRGLTLRGRTAAKTGLDLTSVRVVPRSSLGDPDAPAWELAPAPDGDDAWIVRVPEVAFEMPAAEPLPAMEQTRRSLRTPIGQRMANDHAEVVVYLSGTLVREKSGDLRIEAETTAADGATLSTTSRNTLAIGPALRTPLLPDGHAPLEHRKHDLEQYGLREVARGWVAFDRDWSEIGSVVTRMVSDAAALLMEIARSEPPAPADDPEEAGVIRFCAREPEPETSEGFAADVLRKGGEHLEFARPVDLDPKDATWQRILAELARGADVRLEAGPYDRAMTIEIVSRTEGSNHFPDPESARRYPRIELSWRCHRPATEGARRTLGALGRALLERAGRIERHLGGISLVSGRSCSAGTFTTHYEGLLGLVHHATPEWLSEHVRGPGHHVLVPERAVPKLASADGVRRTELDHGVLLSAEGDDPFDLDPAAMERAVLPLVEVASER